MRPLGVNDTIILLFIWFFWGLPLSLSLGNFLLCSYFSIQWVWGCLLRFDDEDGECASYSRRCLNLVVRVDFFYFTCIFFSLAWKSIRLSFLWSSLNVYTRFTFACRLLFKSRVKLRRMCARGLERTYHRHMQPTDKLVMKATMRESFVGRGVQRVESIKLHAFKFSDNNMVQFLFWCWIGRNALHVLFLIRSFRFMFLIRAWSGPFACVSDWRRECLDTRNRLILFYAPKLDLDWNRLRICIIIIGGHFQETISLHVRLEN